MADISAADVKRLRELTGAGMMACKQALVDADGDPDKAAELIRERTGAKMDKRAAERTAGDGLVHSYLHTPDPSLPAKTGVLLQLNCETDFVAKSGDFQQLAKDIAMQIAAMRPEFVSEADVDEDTLEREREFARKQARDEGKPDHVVERIVEGKIDKYYEESVLLNQIFVRDPDGKKTIGELVTEVQARVGEKIEIARFARFEI